MTTRPEVLGQLANAKNNYVLGLSALALFATPDAHKILECQHASFGTYSVDFRQVALLLRVDADREVAVKEFANMLLRALVKEGFELIKTYAEESGQSQVLKRQEWYQFARLIRNCLAHDFRFSFGRHDESVLPVSWRSRTILANMHGQQLPLEFFGYVQAWELFRDFQTFVECDMR